MAANHLLSPGLSLLSLLYLILPIFLFEVYTVPSILLFMTHTSVSLSPNTRSMSMVDVAAPFC
jgi:hypothetical protein